MKIVTIIGARPQFIKAAPFSAEFRKKNMEILVHTGQHYDQNMSDVFFDELQIPKPDYNLNVGSSTHGKQTARMLEGIEEILMEHKPDGLLVYGDTNSTLAGALAASKLLIPVFHIEAGLRSYNMAMPEEQNRLLTDHISSLLFCPTDTAVKNLEKESIVNNVHNVGDIMYDAVLRNITIANEKYKNNQWLKELNHDNNINLKIEPKDYYLATIHRQENTDDRQKLTNIFEALNMLGKKVVMPLHPRTKKYIADYSIKTDNIQIIDPVGYLMMLYLTQNAYMAITDSGGLQKEAYFLDTPCTTLRDQTEWVETLENEWNILSSTETQEILSKTTRKQTCLTHKKSQKFGTGNAAERICTILMDI